MQVELLRASHCVGESNVHIGLTPKYRKAIFSDDKTRILTRDYIVEASRKHGFVVAAIGFDPDHCHVFITHWKNFAIAKLANLTKGFSSYMMRKHHWELFKKYLYGDSFWSDGYFYRTVGAVNAETVKKYVSESQEYGYEGKALEQRKLIEFRPN
jgi:REP element-mobilizing transposase RayT